MTKANLSPRTPIQVYLDDEERAWLDDLSARLGLSRSEVLRRGVRRLRAEFAAPESPLRSFLRLADADPKLAAAPSDLSRRHTDYFVDALLDRAAESGSATPDATGAP
jgi:Arc/MetJ-type ribon-helix-helix transcriptional regulator